MFLWKICTSRAEVCTSKQDLWFFGVNSGFHCYEAYSFLIHFFIIIEDPRAWCADHEMFTSPVYN